MSKNVGIAALFCGGAIIGAFGYAVMFPLLNQATKLATLVVGAVALFSVLAAVTSCVISKIKNEKACQDSEHLRRRMEAHYRRY